MVQRRVCRTADIFHSPAPTSSKTISTQILWILFDIWCLLNMRFLSLRDTMNVWTCCNTVGGEDLFHYAEVRVFQAISENIFVGHITFSITAFSIFCFISRLRTGVKNHGRYRIRVSEAKRTSWSIELLLYFQTLNSRLRKNTIYFTAFDYYFTTRLKQNECWHF